MPPIPSSTVRSSSASHSPRDVVPEYADVEAASEVLAGKAIETPLLESPALNVLLGGRILLKAETLQRTGSFKFRGAYNRISRIPPEQRAAGVVAYSSGNHAQGVAAAARLLGVPATILMPSDAPAIKMQNTRAHGVEVIPYARGQQSRETLAARIAAERGATIVPPYEDPYIIAGQGTCGREIAHQAEALGARLDALLVCCGGGGLIAGCALAMARLSPETEIYAVEPEGFDDTARSLAAGERVGNEVTAFTSCDALMAPTPGALTFAINRRLVTGGFAVSDAKVVAAMSFAFRTLKLVLEPGGAAALAAILAGHFDGRGKTVAVTLSGGNVDPDTYGRMIASS